MSARSLKGWALSYGKGRGYHWQHKSGAVIVSEGMAREVIRVEGKQDQVFATAGAAMAAHKGE